MRSALLTLLILGMSSGCMGNRSEEDTTIQKEEEFRREDMTSPDQDLPSEDFTEEMEFERDVLSQ